MFIQVTDHNGNRCSIQTDKIIKLRPSLQRLDEPKDTVFIDFCTGGTFAVGQWQELVRTIGSHVKLARLHAPDQTEIAVNAEGIAAIGIDEQYDGRSVAIVTNDFLNLRAPVRNKIALQETVAEAEVLISEALKKGVEV
jgi:hypothetical protein